MTTFKSFLAEHFLLEGGAATDQWGTKRATKQDILDALAFVSKIIGVEVDELKDSLLGSTHVTLNGKKPDSGDIDIALQRSVADQEVIRKKMQKATNNEEYWNAASRVASYAVPTNSGKVQVDLMFVPSKTWAKFSYHSDKGDRSKYSGTVRNLLLVSIAQIRQEPGKDFVIRDKDDNIVARASRSFKLNTGLERLFKVAPKRKDGKGRVKAAGAVTPAELEKEMKDIDPTITFSHEKDTINDPQKAVEWLFWKGVKPEDVMTAEDVMKLIKSDKFSEEERKHIFKNCRKHFEKTDELVPPEFE